MHYRFAVIVPDFGSGTADRFNNWTGNRFPIGGSKLLEARWLPYVLADWLVRVVAEKYNMRNKISHDESRSDVQKNDV
jgi:hypothetical protein